MPVRHSLLLCAMALLGSSADAATQRSSSPSRPNFVIILLDDLGYTDLQFTGNPVIRTPHIDRLAAEGMQLTSMYSTPLCTPTRGELLTSRYPVRTGLLMPTGPGAPTGIRQDEITIAEALKNRGYRTAMFGKWHVGDFDTSPQWNPVNHGFDEFLGIPYSHDYDPAPGVPLYHNLDKVELPVRFELLTQRLTNEAAKFIRASRGRPFFVYLAHPMPHIPVGTSPEFAGGSRGGRYGDVIEELDWSVGQVLEAVRAIGADRNTIIVFMSDNGPWSSALSWTYERQARGNKLPGDVGWTFFRSSKGSTYEGGIRVPGLVRWPGLIAAGRVADDMVSVMDWYPTFLALAGGRLEHSVDGIDQSAFLLGKRAGTRNELFTFYAATIQAIRQGSWKLRVAPAEGEAPTGPPPPSSAPGAAQNQSELLTELFNVDQDPAERLNVAANYPDIVARLRARMRDMQAEVERGAHR